MKRMFGVIVVILMLYIAFQAVYSYTVGRQTNLYNIVIDEDEYQVKEVFTARHKSENRSEVDRNNYYYEISNDNTILFSFKIVGNYVGVTKFLKDLIIYKGTNYICMYPIFKDEAEPMDVICNNQGKLYLYGALKGQKADLDAYVLSLKASGYHHPSWDAPNLGTKPIDNFHLYINNITSDQNLVVWQYKGFHRITDRGEKFFTLISKDKYEPVLTTMVNQYYVIPDYADSYKFTRMFITNLISGSMDTLNLGTSIAYDSFIQGVVDNKIYLIDRNNKRQYTIDIYKKETEVTGDENNDTKYYNNGKWEKRTIYEVIDNNLVFDVEQDIPNNLKALKPMYVDAVGGETDGYYYLYIKENNNISVYRVDKQNTNIMTLLFKINAVKNIRYASGDIYFISNDTLYMYRSSLGLKPLIKYSEFIFNKSNLYNVYVNK
ncbi:MAG: hypothetical protein PHI22_01225 [Bacilli bacterium]|nr:hypothetical protein [Bacilli bacterium]